MFPFFLNTGGITYCFKMKPQLFKKIYTHSFIEENSFDAVPWNEFFCCCKTLEVISKAKPRVDREHGKYKKEVKHSSDMISFSASVKLSSASRKRICLVIANDTMKAY